MKFFNKNFSILILSSGYWRSKFFKTLFSKWAYIKLINVQHESINPSLFKNFDVIMLESDARLNFSLDLIDQSKVFLFNYRDEGTLSELKKAATALRLQKPKFLLLLAPINESTVFSLPLPPPKISDNSYGHIKSLNDRKFDIHFLCSPTFLILETKNSHLPFSILRDGRTLYNQRIEWADQLFKYKMLQNGMGLVEPAAQYLKKDKICALFQCNPRLFTGFVPQKKFNQLFLQTKITLAPAGHSRWTYRLMEGMYYKNLIVSTDLSGFTTLPQIPKKAIISIDDGKFDPQIVKNILKNFQEYLPMAELGYDFARRIYKPKTLFSKGWYTEDAAKDMFGKLSDWFNAHYKT